jgi:hypothetical protein
MGLPPGQAAPDAAGPAPAARGLAADGPAGTEAAASEAVGGAGVAGTESLAGGGRVTGGAGLAGGAGVTGAEGLAGGAGAGGTAGLREPLARARPGTGDARVDDAVARLGDLAGLPLAEHVAVFEYVHERLTEALGDLDVHAPAHAGDRLPGPGGPGG